MSAKASGSDAKANGNATNRSHNDGSSSRAYTVEQKAAVIRIRKCSPTAFYDILGLEEVRTTCGEAEIKKSYRKLSLLTHPDKNGYDGADEAFKMVSRAFQILSDADKKTKYDRFGGDPDSRFGGGPSAASPFSGFARSPGGRAEGMFEEEISPEEMFRQFFGGGGMGPFGPTGFGMPPSYFSGLIDTPTGASPRHLTYRGEALTQHGIELCFDSSHDTDSNNGTAFGGGPEFVFNFGGGPGFRVHQFGGNRPRRRPGDTSHTQEQPQSAMSVLSSLLPLLLLFVFPLLSALFGGFSSTPSYPTFRFDRAAPHTQQHTTTNLHVPYWVNPSDVAQYGNRDWRQLDKIAESRFVGHLNAACESEQLQRQQLVNEAHGWFWTDEEKLERARRMALPNCVKLNDLQRKGRL